MASPRSSGSADRPAAPPEFDTSLFPAPPALYHRYTDDNLADPSNEPPNVDWIVQDGSYTVFGETWPVEELTPRLHEMGVPEMFDPTDAADRLESLQSLLRTLILTYLQLVDALLTPPPSLAQPEPALPTDPERLTEHMRLICINMHYLVNELRPVQVRAHSPCRLKWGPPLLTRRRSLAQNQTKSGSRNPQGHDAESDRPPEAENSRHQTVRTRRYALLPLSQSNS